MRKILLMGTMFSLFTAVSAYAEVNVGVEIGTPAPVIMAPAAPAVVVQQPVYDLHHRDRDWRYWQEQRERQHWEHDHPGGHWDHDRWAHDHH